MDEADQKVEIKRVTSGRANIDGNGVFSTKAVKEGQVISEVAGRETHARTIYSIQIGKNVHLEPGIVGRNLNHSCNPNGYLKLLNGRLLLLAKKDIPKGEHITFDYATTESNTVTRAKCLCGEQNCRGRIEGFNKMTEKWKRENKRFVLGQLL